jgi:Xaa-Pro dipeptidase
MSPRHATFAESEHRERLARARKTMTEAGIAACVCVAPEDLYYLGGYDSWVGVNSPQALIFTADKDEPTIVVRNVDRPLVTETSWVSDIRTYHMHRDDPAALIAQVIAEKGVDGGVLGIEAQSYALTWDWGRTLERALAPAQMIDVTTLLGDLRWFKSPAEVACIRRAAAHARTGIEAARATLRPGITEIAWAAEIEVAMRRQGCDFWAIPIEMAGGPRGAGGHATPRDRVIETGDMLHAEFAGVDARYHVVALPTLAAGEPTKEARDLYDVTRESLVAGMAAIRPGVPVAEVEEASLEPLRRAGLEDAAMMRFGYGIGIAYPPIWLETLQISRGIDQRLAPGMAFVLHACVTLEDSGLGAVLGGTWMLHEDGLEMLAGPGDVPLEVIG